MPLPSLARADRRTLLAVGLMNMVLCTVVGIVCGPSLTGRSLSVPGSIVVSGVLLAAALSAVALLRRSGGASGETAGEAEPFEELAFAQLRLVTDEPEEPDEDDGPQSTWARHDDAEGIRLSGYGRIDFAEGERIVAMHVPFVPPFDVVPEFDFEAEGDASISGKVTQLRSYGVRMEFRRSGALEIPEACRVEWVAHRPAGDVRAA